MRIVVTGASGFSGSHIVPILLTRGNEVVAIAGRGGRRMVFEHHPALTILSADLSQPFALPAAVDAIVHAAARSPAAGVTAADLVRDNAEATRQVIAAAVAGGVKTIVYFSSLSIYGRISDAVVDETTPIVAPDAYGATKYLGEAMLAEAPLRSLSLRLPGIIGPKSVRNWLTGVAEAAQADRLISYYNPATPFNNAVHVDDLARFTADLIGLPGWDGHNAVTLASAGMTTVGHAVELVVRGLGSRSPLNVVPAPRAGFTISIERARAQYGFQPMQIEEALRKFAAEFRHQPFNSVAAR